MNQSRRAALPSSLQPVPRTAPGTIFLNIKSRARPGSERGLSPLLPVAVPILCALDSKAGSHRVSDQLPRQGPQSQHRTVREEQSGGFQMHPWSRSH